MKEFLRLDNKLILKLKIKPLSPLLIKFGTQEKNSNSGTDSYVSFLTTETEAGRRVENDNGKIRFDERTGEIYIPGSSLRGMFRDRFYDILFYQYIEKGFSQEEAEIFSKEEVEKLYGRIDSEENQKIKVVEEKKAQKTRVFIEDAYLYDIENREKFYEKDRKKVSDIKEVIKTRAITPIDHFSGKATVPLTFEYTTEIFFTEIVINNISLKELKALYFILRDSINGELRVGNSKTRGFGQVELEIDEMIYYKYFGKKELIKDMGKYFERVEETSLKLGSNYLYEALKLKKDFEKIDVENPNEFIRALFVEVE